MVEVMTEALDRHWRDDYRRRLEARFNQETIHIRAVGIERLQRDPSHPDSGCAASSPLSKFVPR
jgi:hypothetical protein